jgi:Tfp pilus assembly protein PilW
MLSSRLIHRLRDARGTSLIEVLVAMVTGIVVVAALFSILEVSLHQTARTTDTVQATQLSRKTMTHIVDELRSACIASSHEGYWPIKEKSTGSELRFVSAASSQSEIGSVAASEVNEHRIVYEPKEGTITDYTYPSKSGTLPNFTFSTTPEPKNGIRIGSQITTSQVLNEKGEKETAPIFLYEKYATTSEATTTTPDDTLTRVGSELLTATQAKETASVLIRFHQLPANGDTQPFRSLDTSSQVTFAFAAPLPEEKVKAAPCE